MYANAKYIPGSRQKAAGGISFPREHVIAPGTKLYRFINVNGTGGGRRAGPPQAGADGPWYFEFEHFQTMKTYAERFGYPLGYAARIFAAVIYDWSEVDCYVKSEVTTKQPLFAWKGRGKQIETVDPKTGQPRDARDLATMTPMQTQWEVYQLYIPGLGYPTFEYKNWMQLLHHEMVPTGYPSLDAKGNLVFA